MIQNKRLAVLGILILLFTNCSTSATKDKKLIPVNSLQDILLNLAPMPNTFEVDPTEETMLKGDKGTVIYIPIDAFQFADGSVPSGKVNIELKECYLLTDMIAENLSTTSGTNILETGGMIYLNATADGKQLSVKDGKAFVVGFPNKVGQTKEMDLFYDFSINDTTSTWIPDYKMYEAEAFQTANSDTILTEGNQATKVEYPIEMTDDLYDYGFMNCLTTATFYDLKLKGQNKTIVDYIEDASNIDSLLAREFFKNDWRVHFGFNIDDKGYMNNFKVEDDEYTKYNDRAVQIAMGFLKSAPQFDLASYDQKIKHDWHFALGIMGSRSINWDRFKEKYRGKYSEYKNKAIQQMDETALNYYMFSATKMGWINCDRFWNIEDAEKTNYTITTSMPKDTKVQIVFKDINSIMNGVFQDGKLVFANVPLGRKIKVIGIRYANGKPTLGVAETTIDKKGFELKDFKEFSLDELEKVLTK